MIGRDRQLLSIRKILMQKEGFRVVDVTEPSELFSVQGDVDLIVLCHTVPTEDCELSLSIAAAQWPEARELVLVAWNNEGACGHGAEQFSTLQGPEKLLELVHQLVPAMPLQ
jgi:hypothetical protein